MQGRVKTRLAAHLNEAAVVAVYRAMVEDVLETARSSAFPLELWVDPPGAEPDIADWLGKDLIIRPQPGGIIGRRMAMAFHQSFAHGADRVVLVGTDIPGITGADLDAAFRRLSRSTTVIGPTLDGGYGLIGMSAPTLCRTLFEGIDWGTDRVMAQTRDRLTRAGAAWSEVGSLHDLDTLDDLTAFAADPRHQTTRTAQCIHHLKRVSSGDPSPTVAARTTL